MRGCEGKSGEPVIIQINVDHTKVRQPFPRKQVRTYLILLLWKYLVVRGVAVTIMPSTYFSGGLNFLHGEQRQRMHDLRPKKS